MDRRMGSAVHVARPYPPEPSSSRRVAIEQAWRLAEEARHRHADRPSPGAVPGGRTAQQWRTGPPEQEIEVPGYWPQGWSKPGNRRTALHQHQHGGESRPQHILLQDRSGQPGHRRRCTPPTTKCFPSTPDLGGRAGRQQPVGDFDDHRRADQRGSGPDGLWRGRLILGSKSCGGRRTETNTASGHPSSALSRFDSVGDVQAGFRVARHSFVRP